MSSRGEVDNTGMRPKVGQVSMPLPITFDYSIGGIYRTPFSIIGCSGCCRPPVNSMPCRVLRRVDRLIV